MSTEKKLLSAEEIELKVGELKVKHGCPVHALVFKTDGDAEEIVGYIKEPPRFVKLRVMDKGLTQPMSAASEVVDAYLIKEDSDPRIYSEAQENDKYYLGAVLSAYNLIQLAVNQFKKK